MVRAVPLVRVTGQGVCVLTVVRTVPLVHVTGQGVFVCVLTVVRTVPLVLVAGQGVSVPLGGLEQPLLLAGCQLLAVLPEVATLPPLPGHARRQSLHVLHDVCVTAWWGGGGKGGGGGGGGREGRDRQKRRRQGGETRGGRGGGCPKRKSER